jgi:DNA-binding MarR family transcriptional regulator
MPGSDSGNSKTNVYYCLGSYRHSRSFSLVSKESVEHGQSAGQGLGYLLARARTTLVRAVDLELNGHGITHAQGSILLMLANGKCRTAAELSRELYLDSASMTRMVDRLERRGLLERAARTGDRRVTDLLLTAEGRRLGGLLPGIYKGVIERSFAGLEVEELALLRSLLTKFVDSNKLCPALGRRTGQPQSPDHSTPDNER